LVVSENVKNRMKMWREVLRGTPTKMVLKSPGNSCVGLKEVTGPNRCDLLTRHSQY
jgi:hypothetical protein